MSDQNTKPAKAAKPAKGETHAKKETAKKETPKKATAKSAAPKTAKTKRTKKESAPLETGAVHDAPLLETPVTQAPPLLQAPETPETPLLQAPETQDAPLLQAPVASSETNAADTAPETRDAPLGTLSASVEPGGGEIVASAPAPKHEALRLPKGAFLAFRKSGGLHFSSREVVVYPDGRVAYDARGVPQKEYNRLPRVLNDGQVHALRRLLDHVNFWRAESVGEQNPDAFAYEIAARLGQNANQVQVFDGSVPENLTPLLERLTPLLPQE